MGSIAPNPRNAKRYTVPKVCRACGKEFLARRDRAAKGGHNYCSRECYMKHGGRHAALELRFWGRVAKTESGCWLWTGSRRGASGHGGVSAFGKQQYAHRVAWILLNGPIPDGHEVCHNCPSGDNPLCVNPDHLFLGTHEQNMEDAGRKGRMGVARGQKSGRAKLTDDAVREIRRRYALGGSSQRAIADEYGMSERMIHDIIKRRFWKHITD